MSAAALLPSPEQQQVISHRAGHLQVIACAGAGKTEAISRLPLPTIASRIGVELRNQYVLAYSPNNHTKDGKYHKLEVKIDQPAALPHLTARWRLGYYAPNE